jgi:hypothetical protein
LTDTSGTFESDLTFGLDSCVIGPTITSNGHRTLAYQTGMTALSVVMVIHDMAPPPSLILASPAASVRNGPPDRAETYSTLISAFLTPVPSPSWTKTFCSRPALSGGTEPPRINTIEIMSRSCFGEFGGNAFGCALPHVGNTKIDAKAATPKSR